MTAAPGCEALAFRRRRRRAVERLARDAVSVLGATLAFGVIVGSGPVDYQLYGWLVENIATVVAVVTVSIFVLRLILGSRVSVVLTPKGIETGRPGRERIPWSDIAGVRAVRQLADRHVLLTRRDGTTVRLDAPWGSGWLPDPMFERDMAELRQWAARYGTAIRPDRQHRRRPAVAVAVAVLTVLTAVGVRAADRGVIWPWMATASQVTAACPALQAAGLDRFWHADTRTLERDEQDQHELGESSYCWWVRRLGRTQQAPFIRLSAVVRRHDAIAMSSPIAMAIRSYNSDRDAESSPEPVPALGDEAFTTSTDDEVLVAARRANVTVSISVDQEPQDPEEAETAARTLAAAILAGIRLDG